MKDKDVKKISLDETVDAIEMLCEYVENMREKTTKHLSESEDDKAMEFVGTTTELLKDNRRIRSQVISEANNIINGDREDDYGSARDSFEATRALWSDYLSARFKKEIVLEPEDIAVMQTLLKVSRIATGGFGKRDTWVDMIGYSALGAEVALERKE